MQIIELPSEDVVCVYVCVLVMFFIVTKFAQKQFVNRAHKMKKKRKQTRLTWHVSGSY